MAQQALRIGDWVKVRSDLLNRVQRYSMLVVDLPSDAKGLFVVAWRNPSTGAVLEAPMPAAALQLVARARS